MTTTQKFPLQTDEKCKFEVDVINTTKYAGPVPFEGDANGFTTLRDAFKTSLWSFFDPGHPEVVGCAKGVPRSLGRFLLLTIGLECNFFSRIYFNDVPNENY